MPETDTPAQPTAPGPRPGPLFVVGGAEDKIRRRTVLEAFAAAAGGEAARIAVVPTASSLGTEIVDVYAAAFAKLGVAEVLGVRPESREQADSAAYADALDDVSGVFMTGGNQLKLSGVISGTAFGEAILAAHRRGAAVGGTSAGASIQSSVMVAFGPGGSTAKQRMTQVAAGLGLVPDAVIDQHFAQRNRYGRLLMIVAQNPQLLGIGVDEDTAAVIRKAPPGSESGDRLEVIGNGSVTVFDPARMVSSAHEAPRSRPILASGVTLHALPAGSSFDLTNRTLIAVGPQADAAELADANRDLRRLARDIAAGDVSPTNLRRRLARRNKGAE